MRRATVAIGVVAGGLLVVVAGGFYFRGRVQSSPSAGATAAQTPSTERAATGQAPGPFMSLLGRDLRAELDRYLMLELKADLPSRAEEALRAKLAAFLRAYSGTDFGQYLAFRPLETMCGLDDPRLQATLAAWSPQFGPAPSDSAGVMRVPWRMYVEQGMGPVKPGAVMDAIQWSSCRAILRSISEHDLIPAEWDESNTSGSHLSKEAATRAAGEDSRVPYLVMRLAVPNAQTVTQLAERDGRVLFADFDVTCRRGQATPQRLVLRFVWDGAFEAWLPLHALVYGGSLEKPFIW